MGKEKSLLIRCIHSYEAFGVCRARAGCSIGFLVIPCYSIEILLIEARECVSKCSYTGINWITLKHEAVRLLFRIIIAVGVASSFGGNFEDNPPLDGLSVFVKAAEGGDEPKNKSIKSDFEHFL